MAAWTARYRSHAAFNLSQIMPFDEWCDRRRPSVLEQAMYWRIVEEYQKTVRDIDSGLGPLLYKLHVTGSTSAEMACLIKNQTIKDSDNQNGKRR